MELNPFHFTKISPDLFVYQGAVNTGILRWGDRAILIDCDDTLSPTKLGELGIHGVERIYCTQHRRPNTAGTAAFEAAVYAPQSERRQFEEASAYWQDWHNRCHLYHFRPGILSPLQDIPLAGTVGESDTFQWGPFVISVLETPGMTDGAVSYIVQPGDTPNKTNAIVFCGDVLYKEGQVWDVFSLQKNMGGLSDYHGFLGAAGLLIASLKKLGGTNASFLVPSHGNVIPSPSEAAKQTVHRLEQLYRNYASISAINFYFPDIFAELSDDPLRMKPALVLDFPDFILPVAATSFAIRSNSGALFLIDCGYDRVLDQLAEWKEQKLFSDLEGCWVTHYHDDHVDALHHLATSFSTPIFADEHLAEIVIHPSRFFLPCISPAAAPVDLVTRDGQTWRWREFELTAIHFPGQTFYHGGLLVQGHGLKVLFCGDSFAPTGLDDYTAGNRNFLGAGMGFRRCIDIVRQFQPDLILNQHQQQAFRFSEEQLKYMEQMLIDREQLLSELLPWENPNYGTDEGWIRAYPYDMNACPGSTCVIQVRATSHAARRIEMKAEAVLPPGWETANDVQPSSFEVESPGERIVITPVSITISADTRKGLYPVAFRITWNGRYLGQVCHAFIRVC